MDGGWSPRFSFWVGYEGKRTGSFQRKEEGGVDRGVSMQGEDRLEQGEVAAGGGEVPGAGE
eukprot:746495-Hanusia_phi.AAC.4